MREFGVRRYGDAVYHHCLAATAEDAAVWFAHNQVGLSRKDFQALVKDVAEPVTDESGIGGNPRVVTFQHEALTEGARNVTDLKTTSPLQRPGSAPAPRVASRAFEDVHTPNGQ